MIEHCNCCDCEAECEHDRGPCPGIETPEAVDGGASTGAEPVAVGCKGCGYMSGWMRVDPLAEMVGQSEHDEYNENHAIECMMPVSPLYTHPAAPGPERVDVGAWLRERANERAWVPTGPQYESTVLREAASAFEREHPRPVVDGATQSSWLEHGRHDKPAADCHLCATPKGADNE